MTEISSAFSVMVLGRETIATYPSKLREAFAEAVECWRRRPSSSRCGTRLACAFRASPISPSGNTWSSCMRRGRSPATVTSIPGPESASRPSASSASTSAFSGSYPAPSSASRRRSGDYVLRRQYEDDIFDVRFLRTDRLNEELHGFLLEMGYDSVDVAFIGTLKHVVPSAAPRSGSPSAPPATIGSPSTLPT